MMRPPLPVSSPWLQELACNVDDTQGMKTFTSQCCKRTKDFFIA